MFGFRINEEFLDLEPNTSLSMELHNPLFNTEIEKGMLTYDISVLPTDKNRKLLKHAGSLSIRSFGNKPLPCQLWIKNTLYKVGKLYVMERDAKYKVQFVSDAGDLATMAYDQLRDIDLGTVPLVMNAFPTPDAAYSWPTVINNMDGETVLNFYDPPLSTYVAPMVPMPWLVKTMQQVLAVYGYTLKGSWLDENKLLCILNPVVATDTVQLNRHLPDITVADFLKSIRKHFGLALVFHSKTKELEIVKLKDALADTDYRDWTHLADDTSRWVSNTTDGFTLQMAIDSDDAMQKGREREYQYKTGNGADPIDTGIGTAATGGVLSNGMDALEIRQAWQDYETGGKFAFRVIKGGAQYPEQVPIEAIAANYTDWLAFKSETESIGRTLNLGIAELLHLEPVKKVLIRTPQGMLKAFWEKVSINLSLNGEMKSKVQFLKVMQ